MTKASLAPILLALAAAGCTTPRGDRGLETPHQPIVDATGAHVPHCPDWSLAGGPATEGQSSNFGCATMTNLAAMVADPADLLHGRTDGANSPGDLATKAIKTWREIAPTSKLWVTTTPTSTTGGAQK